MSKISRNILEKGTLWFFRLQAHQFFFLSFSPYSFHSVVKPSKPLAKSMAKMTRRQIPEILIGVFYKSRTEDWYRFKIHTLVFYRSLMSSINLFHFRIKYTRWFQRNFNSSLVLVAVCLKFRCVKSNFCKVGSNNYRQLHEESLYHTLAKTVFCIYLWKKKWIQLSPFISRRREEKITTLHSWI